MPSLTSEGASAHWVIAALLNHSRHFDAALKEVQEALGKATESLEKFRILDLTANIHLSLEDTDAAYAVISNSLSIPDIPPALLRKVSSLEPG